MTVAELIAELQKYPADMEVKRYSETATIGVDIADVKRDSGWDGQPPHVVLS